MTAPVAAAAGASRITPEHSSRPPQHLRDARRARPRPDNVYLATTRPQTPQRLRSSSVRCSPAGVNNRLISYWGSQSSRARRAGRCWVIVAAARCIATDFCRCVWSVYLIVFQAASKIRSKCCKRRLKVVDSWFNLYLKDLFDNIEST